MITTRNIASWLWSSLMMVGLLMLVACSEESDEPLGGNLHLSTVTRSGAHVTSGSVKMFVTTNDDVFSSGAFNYTTSWEKQDGGVAVGEHAQYYIYGFMPSNIADNSSVAKPAEGSDYSNGADMTLTALPMFPTDDICVIVGVRKVSASSEETEAVEGNYGYLSGLNSENYVNLLMDHLYSQLILQFNVDPDYNALRHIKLKTVTLTSTYGDKVDAIVKFRAGNSLGANTVIYSPNSGATANISKEILTASDAKFITTTATETNFGPFNCAPCTFDANGTNLTLTCIYDVYNTAEDKVLRANCTVTNKLKVMNMDHGVRKTLTLTIAPTYLYTLSDYDLNNPTIVVN